MTITEQDAAAMAVKISEKVEPKLTEQEQAFFIAGFCECAKYASTINENKESNETIGIDEILLNKAKGLNLHVDFSDKGYDGDKDAPMDRFGLLIYLLDLIPKSQPKKIK